VRERPARVGSRLGWKKIFLNPPSPVPILPRSGGKILAMEPLPNPYEPPQMPLAQLVPTAEPGNFAPGELPCHRCGQPVPPRARRCPACDARPLFDRLQLWLTAIPIFVIWTGTIVTQQLRGSTDTLPLSLLFAIVSITGIWFGMQALFKKLRRGKW
jgi:hypothetical protein